MIEKYLVGLFLGTDTPQAFITAIFVTIGKAQLCRVLVWGDTSWLIIYVCEKSAAFQIHVTIDAFVMGIENHINSSKICHRIIE
jgi:hypothetical protein